MIRLLSVVGARPTFMKIAPIVEELKNFHDIEHCLVHLDSTTTTFSPAVSSRT
ncbi:MAG: hypothetical protein ABSE28_16945 [Candidatus Sulfotelmatobacter sp.]|jgi:UDP-N-acetylglucosamine 2-epimerase